MTTLRLSRETILAAAVIILLSAHPAAAYLCRADNSCPPLYLACANACSRYDLDCTGKCPSSDPTNPFSSRDPDCVANCDAFNCECLENCHEAYCTWQSVAAINGAPVPVGTFLASLR